MASNITLGLNTVGLILKLEKSYTKHLLEFLVINEACLWNSINLNLLGEFCVYASRSSIAIRFLINFLNEVALLHNISEIDGATLTQTKAPGVNLIRQLLQEEGTPVQKKYGSRYHQFGPQKVTKYRRYLNNAVLDDRGYVFSNTNNINSGGPLKYVLWNANVMSGNFFFQHFWLTERNSIVKIQTGVWFTSISTLAYLVQLLTLLKVNSINRCVISKAIF